MGRENRRIHFFPLFLWALDHWTLTRNRRLTLGLFGTNMALMPGRWAPTQRSCTTNTQLALSGHSLGQTLTSTSQKFLSKAHQFMVAVHGEKRYER
jgi:hypothetical protein